MNLTGRYQQQQLEPTRYCKLPVASNSSSTSFLVKHRRVPLLAQHTMTATLLLLLLLQVLLRRSKHNPLLVGEAGVGKTAIVEGIAQLMVGQAPARG
jgi:midasin (ATPase involved in ribosome maturation)